MAEPAKLLDIIREAGKQPQYQEMTEYLMARRAMPPIPSQQYLGPGVYGSFAIPRGDRSPIGPAGKITIGTRPTLEGGINTLTHEITHAADRQLSKQYSEEKYPGGFVRGKNQFTDAYEKLSYNPDALAEAPEKVPARQLMKLLAPAWQKANEGYRSTVSEAYAFALGNSTTPKDAMPPENAPPHIDATLATEFLILLDLAKRSQAKRPQSQGR